MEREQKYLEICSELKVLIEATGEPLEGNCMYRHLTLDTWDCLLNKRKNYQLAVKNKQTICEIGFNAGHSILAMILSNPNAKYTLFDLGVHSYSKPCFEYLRKLFPNVSIEIIWGDSRSTLPTYHHKYPNVTFDLIHIDGGHQREVYSADWKNSLDMSLKGSLLIFDDTDNNKINAFLDEEIQKGVVSEADKFLETFGYKHRILVKK